MVVARDGGRDLAALPSEARAQIITNLAFLLMDNQADILEANRTDINIAKKAGTIILCQI